MARSDQILDLVIAVDYILDRAMWTTPAAAKRFCQELSHREIIDETHPDRAYWESRLPPKPEIVLQRPNRFVEEE